MKICTKCGIEKDESEFVRNKNCKSGYEGICKECRLEYKRKYRLENHEKTYISEKKYRLKNKEKWILYTKKWELNNPEKVIIKQKRIRKRRSIELNNIYVKSTITKQFKIKTSEITPELIELKRIELTNKRLIKKLKENETK